MMMILQEKYRKDSSLKCPKCNLHKATKYRYNIEWFKNMQHYKIKRLPNQKFKF